MNIQDIRNGCYYMFGNKKFNFDNIIYNKEYNIITDIQCNICNNQFNKSYDVIYNTLLQCDNCLNTQRIISTNLLIGKLGIQPNVSNGQQYVMDMLDMNDISYVLEKTYDDLVNDNNNHLRFDIYLTKYNVIIEYDGNQHYKHTPFFHKTEGAFIKQQYYDNIKNEYCKNNDIILYRIHESTNVQNIIIKIMTS